MQWSSIRLSQASLSTSIYWAISNTFVCLLPFTLSWLLILICFDTPPPTHTHFLLPPKNPIMFCTVPECSLSCSQFHFLLHHIGNSVLIQFAWHSGGHLFYWIILMGSSVIILGAVNSITLFPQVRLLGFLQLSFCLWFSWWIFFLCVCLICLTFSQII